MSAILNRDMAVNAVRIAGMAFRGMKHENFLNRNALHIVVLDPSKYFGSCGFFEQAILYEESFGAPREEWERPFDEFARAKAMLSWRTGMDTHLVQQRFPHLYNEGDITFGGGVYRDGIVVGVSGVQWFFDQMFAELTVSACKALSIQRMIDVLASASPYIKQSSI